jgi:hypothetical protein
LNFRGHFLELLLLLIEDLLAVTTASTASALYSSGPICHTSI